jgi:hypothetical protein
VARGVSYRCSAAEKLLPPRDDVHLYFNEIGGCLTECITVDHSGQLGVSGTIRAELEPNRTQEKLLNTTVLGGLLIRRFWVRFPGSAHKVAGQGGFRPSLSHFSRTLAVNLPRMRGLEMGTMRERSAGTPAVSCPHAQRRRSTTCSLTHTRAGIRSIT